MCIRDRYNPAEDTLKVNGNSLSATALYGSGGTLKLAAANHSSTSYVEVTSFVSISMATNKVVRFSGGIGEIGNVTGFQATNDANNALTSFGMRAADLRFATGSAERLRIDSSGNILLSKGAQNTLMSNTSDGSDNQSIFVGGGGAPSDTRGAYIWAKGNEYTTTGGYLQLNAGNVGTAPITFSTGGGERVRITSGGYMGINTTTPGRYLHIVGNDGATGATIGNSDTQLVIDNTGTNGTIMEFLSSTSGALSLIHI